MQKRSISAYTPAAVEEILLGHFGFLPTPSQEKLVKALSRFVISNKPNCLLVVKGYAGTGKTTMVNSLVKTLDEIGLRHVLLAPTGRAAKVLGNYSGQRAFTIHKKIYFQNKTRDGKPFFAPAQNLHRNTVFVVDEASMIGWDTYTGPMGGNLLLDLFEYVYNGQNCRLVLIGDGAQLPPVGSPLSPALDLKFLQSQFTVTAASCELTDVMRQKDDSGILSLATAVRDAMSKPPAESLPFVAPPTPDVKLINGMELQDHLEAAFASAGEEGAMLITRSNKRANLFNKEVRARVLFREDDINAGDLIMVVKNNYHWLGPESKAGFIANGDVLEVLRLGRRENRFGFNFVNATVRMIDYPDEPDTEVMLWLNAIDTEGPSMGAADQNTLYTGVLETYADLKTKEERRKALRTDPFYNALQIKFAYAVTCHKAQGGQWPVVFIDQGYMTDEMLDIEYLRWLYTAITRAREKLFLLNFSDAVFEQE
jgi:exodeoxyribonuclease-5